MTADQKVATVSARSARNSIRGVTRWLDVGAAGLVGLVSFLTVIGPAPLQPTNILWLRHGRDTAQAYLGWAFYRASPWTWPLTANPRYGLELSSSVQMSGSIPILAIPFKLFSPFLPMPFQYFGWWLLSCFIMQAIFGYLIAERIFRDRFLSIISSLLFTFVPLFMFRFAGKFHLELCSQWQLLAAILLYFSPKAPIRTALWTLLLTFGVLTDLYLLVMTSTIWLADVLRSIRLRQRRNSEIYLRASVVVTTVIAIVIVSGVYTFPDSSHTLSVSQAFGSAAMGELGVYRFNLLSPFDSQGWSYIFPERRHPGIGEFEGFAFLGAGWMFLLLCAASVTLRRPNLLKIGHEHRPLIVCVSALVIFAISPIVAVGNTIIVVPWPNSLLLLAAILRSTGRFVWPAFYLGAIVILCLLTKSLKTKFLAPLLLVAVILQIGDTRAGWGQFSREMAQEGSSWPSPMKSPLWKRWARIYHSVRLGTPIDHYSPFLHDVSYFAVENGLGTDAAYLARVNARGLAAISAQAAQSKATGNYDRHSLWILDRSTYQMLQSRPRCNGDFLGQVDGYLVLAPAPRRTDPGGNVNCRP